MTLYRFLCWLVAAAALAFLGDDLMLRGELGKRWQLAAAGRVLYAYSLSMLLVLAVALCEMRP